MWCDYSVKKLKPLIEARRFDDNAGNRFYWWVENEDIKIASGVTTPFGKVSTERENIQFWKDSHPNWRHLLNVSSEYGIAEHICFKNIMLGQPLNPEDLAKMQKLAYENDSSNDMPFKDMLAFLKFHEDYKLVPLIIEGILIWKDPTTNEYLAMTIDLLAELDIPTTTKELVEDGVYLRGDKKGQPKFKEVKTEIITKEIILLDFKGNFFEKDKKSFFETNKMQLMAGKLAVEQNFNLTVTKLFNLAPNAWRTAPSYTLFEQKVDDNDWGLFYDYWRLIIRKGLNKPEGKILITGEFKNSSDFRYLCYVDYVKEVLMKDTTPIEVTEPKKRGRKKILNLLKDEVSDNGSK